MGITFKLDVPISDVFTEKPDFNSSESPQKQCVLRKLNCFYALSFPVLLNPFFSLVEKFKNF